jgi:hypothetical protein
VFWVAELSSRAVDVQNFLRNVPGLSLRELGGSKYHVSMCCVCVCVCARTCACSSLDTLIHS